MYHLLKTIIPHLLHLLRLPHINHHPTKLEFTSCLYLRTKSNYYLKKFFKKIKKNNFKDYLIFVLVDIILWVIYQRIIYLYFVRIYIGYLGIFLYFRHIYFYKSQNKFKYKLSWNLQSNSDIAKIPLNWIIESDIPSVSKNYANSNLIDLS